MEERRGIVEAVGCGATHQFSKPRRKVIHLVAGHGIEGDPRHTVCRGAHQGRSIDPDGRHVALRVLERAHVGGRPQDQNIQTAVLAAGRCVPPHRQRCLRRRRPPGLHPGRTAGFELGDDLVGDFVIEVRPIFAGARPTGMSGS